MMPLENEFVDLRLKMSQIHHKNPQVSEQGVDWHLDHALKVIIIVCKTLKKTNPKDFKSEYNPHKTLVFRSGKIPRNVAKAPKGTISTKKVDVNLLETQFEEAEKLVREIQNLPANSYMRHHVFGMINLEESIRFMKIHTQHHLQIMDEIIGEKI